MKTTKFNYIMGFLCLGISICSAVLACWLSRPTYVEASPCINSDVLWAIGPFGDGGRLFLKDSKFSVALYEDDASSLEESQKQIDKKEAAIIRNDGNGHYLIMDHSRDGFRCIKDAVEGKSIAYIQILGKETVYYKCMEVDLNGYYENQKLRDCKGDTYYDHGYDLCMATCSDEEGGLYITWWQEL